MQRDPIYAALVNQLNALTLAPLTSQYGFVQVVSRGFVSWEQADAQPAIYVVPLTEKAEYKRGLPTKWWFKLDLYVYVRWIDSVAQGVTALTQVMDGIDFVLSPMNPPNAGQGSDNGFVNTLGGLCSYCALQGEAEISGGFLNRQQTVARMPMEIVVA
jgi:hypothetical protein